MNVIPKPLNISLKSVNHFTQYPFQIMRTNGHLGDIMVIEKGNEISKPTQIAAKVVCIHFTKA